MYKNLIVALSFSKNSSWFSFYIMALCMHTTNLYKIYELLFFSVVTKELLESGGIDLTLGRNEKGMAVCFHCFIVKYQKYWLADCFVSEC